jgi:O-antigen/teichoic acid export membrane protein
MTEERASVVQSGAVAPGAVAQQSNNSERPSSSPGVVTGLGRNALWRYIALGAMAAEGIAVAAVALRHLGTSGYGAFALAAATIGLLATIDFGLALSVMRSVAKDNDQFPENEREAARRDVAVAHATYVLFGAAALVATAFVVWLLPNLTRSEGIGLGQDRLTILLVGASIGIYLATAVFDGIPSGRSRFSVIAAASSAGAVANVVFVVATIGHLHLVALGAGQLIGTIVTRAIGGAWILRHETWFHFRPTRARRSDLRRVAMFTLPLLVLSVGGQLIVATDLLVIGALSTAAAVALYRVGSLGPNQLVSLVYAGFDATFPSLSASSSKEEQENAVAFLTRVACYGAGIGFGTLVMLRVDIVGLVVGHSNHLATTVLIVFSGVWLANVPVHGLALLLIARGRQSSFIPLVAAEAGVNFALTIGFVFAFGPVGAAFATLVAIVISNDIVLPFLVRHEFRLSPHLIVWRDGFPAIAIGVGVSALSVLPFYALHAGPGRLVLGALTALAFGLGIGYVLLGPSGRDRFMTMMRTTRGTGGPLQALAAEGVSR